MPVLTSPFDITTKMLLLLKDRMEPEALTALTVFADNLKKLITLLMY